MKMSDLLCEGPKPQNAMISRFVTPGEPLFIDLNYTKMLHKYEKDMDTISNNNLFINIRFLQIKTFEKMGQN